MFGELLNELPSLLIWYGVFLILGFAVLPFLQKYFSDWRDGGYGIAKFIGLAVVSLPLWFLSALHIVPFTQATSAIFFVALIILAIWYTYKNKIKISRSTVKWIILEEILFFIVFFSWIFIRSTNSQAEGTEKMMNLAFMNSIFRTEYFPALDPWYAGATINYYHLGHYMFTFVAKMTGIKVSFAYNLTLMIIAAFTFVGIFSIVVKLIDSQVRAKRAVLAGLFASIWIMFGANMHYLYKWLEALFNNKVFEYWFPDGTRIITNAIDEFPAYSIPLGDVHGHYLGMPFLVVAIALIIVTFGIKINSKDKVRFNMIISPLIWAIYGVNTWDFITINFIFVLIHLYQAFSTYHNWFDRMVSFVVSELSLSIIGVLFMIPYIVSFKPAVGGLGIVPIGQTSTYIPWMQMWGMFLVITFIFVYTRALASKNKILQVISLTVLGIVLATPIIGHLEFQKVDPLNSKNMVQVDNLWPVIGILVAIIVVIFLLSLLITFLIQKVKLQLDYKVGKYEALVILFNVAAFALLFGVEILFVKDIFYHSNPPYFRTNTVFKFYYHAWIIWGISCGYYVYKIFATYLSAKKNAYRIIGSTFAFIIMFLFVGSVTYIFEGIRDFYPFFKYDDIKYPTLEQLQSPDINEHIKLYESIDGNYYIKKFHLGDYKAMQWFSENVKGQPVIAEATHGDAAYSYFCRFSANLGLIDIMGWPTHEWQWRSNPVVVLDDKGQPAKDEKGNIKYEDLASKDAFARKDEVEKIYTTEDDSEFKALIIKYDVQYIVVGEMERDSKAYGDRINETYMQKYGAKVYDDLDTKIYKIKFVN
jgi:YYY domain-containing protein